MAASPADRGKAAEGEVKKVLTRLALQSDTAFTRLPDARSGSFQATLADFLVVRRGVPFLLEVKEVEHDYRLPHGNFSTDQVSRLRRFELAGAESHVLVLHSKLGKWRTARVDYFLTREGGSWDLRNLPLQDLKDILK